MRTGQGLSYRMERRRVTQAAAATPRPARMSAEGSGTATNVR